MTVAEIIATLQTLAQVGKLSLEEIQRLHEITATAFAAVIEHQKNIEAQGRATPPGPIMKKEF